MGKFAAFGKDRALNKMRERGGRRLVSVGENCVISSLCVVTSVKWCSLSCCWIAPFIRQLCLLLSSVSE